MKTRLVRFFSIETEMLFQTEINTDGGFSYFYFNSSTFWKFSSDTNVFLL